MNETRLGHAIAKLRGLDHKQPEYVVEFEQILVEVDGLNEPGSIAALTEFLDDDAEYDELMFSIIHSIERFEDTIYCQELLRATPLLWARSPRWASILYVRVINSESSRNALMSTLATASAEAKSSLSEILRRLDARSPQLRDQTAPIRALL